MSDTRTGNQLEEVGNKALPFVKNAFRNRNFLRTMESHSRPFHNTKDHCNLKPLTSEQVERWYERLTAELLEWMIELDGSCIGTARLHHVDTRGSLHCW